MAAPIGNQFWNLRMKHGRDKVIQDPDALLDNFNQYCQWIQDNPLIEEDWVGKDAVPVERKKMRAITKYGIAVACGVSEWKKISQLKQVSEDFRKVVTHIESVIANYNIQGSAAGFLNPNIISRLEGLAERTENNHSISELPPWMKDE